MTVFTAHTVYRYEDDSNPHGFLVGVFYNEADATVAAFETVKSMGGDYYPEVMQWDVLGETP